MISAANEDSSLGVPVSSHPQWCVCACVCVRVCTCAGTGKSALLRGVSERESTHMDARMCVLCERVRIKAPKNGFRSKK